MQFGGIVAFSLVTETVFQWPGMGLLLVQSVAVADIPVMSAYLLLMRLVFVLINLVVDLLYYAVDPRLRMDRRGGGAHDERRLGASALQDPAIAAARQRPRCTASAASPVAMLSAAIAADLVGRRGASRRGSRRTTRWTSPA